MKTVKYILFSLLFLFISCKSLKNKNSVTEKENTVNLNMDYDRDGVVDQLEMSGDMIKSVAIEVETKPTNNKPNKKKTPKKVKEEKTTILENQYSEGLMAYKVPKSMIVGNSYLVKIRITKENNKTMLVVGDRKIPISDEENNSVVEVENINISPIMSANLIVSKNSFKIDTLSTEYQNISKTGYTEWAWNIIPLKSGYNLLKLNVKIRIKEDGEVYYKDIVVFDKKLKIKSNIKFNIVTWFNEYWQWLFGVILIPLIKWLYEKYKDKKKEGC